jgi:hypothetical protein
MSNINKEIKQYLVQLKFNGNGNGSGVIVKLPHENIAYIFTAKHTFEEDKDSETERGTLFDTDYIIESTRVLTANEEELSIKNVIELDNIGLEKDSQKIDLLIFEITYCEYLSKISSLSIYNDEFEKCTVSGFPKVNDDYKGLAYIPSEFIHSDKNYYFEFDPKKILFNSEDTEVDVIGGISGGGVFVKGNDGQVYLAGIETGLYGVNNLEAVYLIKIIEKINEKVDTKIPTGGFKPLKGFEYQSLSLEFLANNLKNDYIKSMEREEDILQVLDDENNEENDKLEKNFKQTRENLKILSISYLYRGIKFNGYNNYKATANFKKAMLLNKEEVEKYFILAKSKRKPKQKQIDKNSDNNIENILIEIDKLKEEIENTNDYELLEELYIDLIYSLGKINQHEELLKYRKKLIDLYIENKEFNQAERELKRKSDLDKNYIGQKLRDIYLNEKYTKKLNDEEIAKKLFYLLALLEDESEKDKIRKKIDDLNLYNQNMLVLNEEFSTMKYQIKDYQSKIETLTGMLVNGTKNQEILAQVLQTDENISKKIDERTYEITQKLDEVKITIIKTNSQELNNFLDNVYRSTQALVSKIQTMYHQNDRVNKKAKIALDNSIKSMNEQIENYLSKPIEFTNNMAEIKEIIESSNWNFYKGIQGLYEKESDSYSRKLLEMSIAFTKREHELHIDNLLKNKDTEVEKLKKFIDELTINYKNSKNKSIEKEEEIIQLERKFNSFKEKFNNDAEKVTNIDRFKYEDEIEDLKKDIEQLNIKNKQIDELKESITLSSETAKRLERLEENNKGILEKYIQEIKQKYEELDDVKKDIIEGDFTTTLKDINSSICSLPSGTLDEENFENINKQLEKLDDKLDTVSEKIEDLNLENFIKVIQENNKDLIDKIQKIYPENIEQNKQAQASLHHNMNEIQTFAGLSKNTIVQNLDDSNTLLYKEIKEIYKENQDLTKSKLLAMAIELTQQKYEDDIKRIKEEQFEWEKGLNEKYKQKTYNKEFNELKLTIDKVHKTSENLNILEANYEEKIKSIEDRFKKIKHNPKNEKRLRKIFNKLIEFENKLDNIKPNDPKITLHLLESDLEKIENIMSKRKSKCYSLYCIIEVIILGVMAMVSLLLYEPFWEIYKQLMVFLGL